MAVNMKILAGKDNMYTRQFYNMAEEIKGTFNPAKKFYSIKH